MKTQKRASCFTLIELLVVIAIIAILAAILLPALNKARERGVQTDCMSRQKNIGTAINMYRGEYNDMLVSQNAKTGVGSSVPVTYVPARNLVFLSLAASWGEVLGAHDIFIGVNSVDYSNYPDCRAPFIASFAETVRLGTCAVDEDWQWNIHTPLQNLSKAEIIKLGTSLGVDYSLTTSCYDPDNAGRSCGKCDSCRLRHQGFVDAGVPDPTNYQ